VTARCTTADKLLREVAARPPDVAIVDIRIPPTTPTKASERNSKLLAAFSTAFHLTLAGDHRRPELERRDHTLAFLSEERRDPGQCVLDSS
jgi:hypothetical protein